MRIGELEANWRRIGDFKVQTRKSQDQGVKDQTRMQELKLLPQHVSVSVKNQIPDT